MQQPQYQVIPQAVVTHAAPVIVQRQVVQQRLIQPVVVQRQVIQQRVVQPVQRQRSFSFQRTVIR